jgi:hypothetical protein
LVPPRVSCVRWRVVWRGVSGPFSILAWWRTAHEATDDVNPSEVVSLPLWRRYHGLRSYAAFHVLPVAAGRSSASALCRHPSQCLACVFLTYSIVRCYLGFAEAHRSVLYLRRPLLPTLLAGGPLAVIGLRPVSVSIFLVGCALVTIAMVGVYLHCRSVHPALSRVHPCQPLGPLPPPCTGTHLPSWWCSCPRHDGWCPSSSPMEWVPSTSTVGPRDGHVSARVEHQYVRAQAAQEPTRVVGALPVRDLSVFLSTIFFG